MIYTDNRIGSKELAGLISDSVLVELEYGDFTFEGNGPTGKIQIGVERKTVNDMISSISTGRFGGHQLPGLLENYNRVYLVVEGQWQANRKTGTLEVFRHGKFKLMGESKFSSKRLWGYLIAVGAVTGVQVVITTNTMETVVFIEELHQWWNQPWDKHVDHAMNNKMTAPTTYLVPGKLSLLKRLAAELPGVGYRKLSQVETKFGTVGRMWEATVEEWMEIEGVGKLTAERVWRCLHE